MGEAIAEFQAEESKAAGHEVPLEIKSIDACVEREPSEAFAEETWYLLEAREVNELMKEYKTIKRNNSTG